MVTVPNRTGRRIRKFAGRLNVVRDRVRCAGRRTPVKFFTVTKEGKLEAIDADKATGMLKQKNAGSDRRRAKTSIRESWN